MWALGSKPRARHWEVFCGLFLPFRMPGARNTSAAGHFFGTAAARARNVRARWPIEWFHPMVLVSGECPESSLRVLRPLGALKVRPHFGPKIVLSGARQVR